MIHKYSLFGTNIVLDVNSGAVHVFDDTSSDVLDLYAKYNEDQILDMLLGRHDKTDIESAFIEIEELVREGQLFSEDEFRDSLLLAPVKPVVKALCLHVSHDCNLRCSYCFAASGSFGGEREKMSTETGKKAIDFLIRESANRKHLEIDFFGGEPMMNFNVVKDLVKYALSKEIEHGKKFKFTLTTNAMLLNEQHMEFINKYIGNIVMSADGRPETNDKMRTCPDGKGSYDIIMPKIMAMAESRKQDNYYVRGTFTRANPDFSLDVLHLADRGFTQISVEPVVAAKDTGFDIREEDLPVLFDQYEKLAKEYVNRRNSGKSFNFFHFMIDLERGPCVSKRLGGCGSGHEYMAVAPNGDIYPCHQFVGNIDFKLGNVNTGIVNRDIRNKFRESNIFTKAECAGCWAKFYCSGGCAANAYQFNNDINIPYKIGCELEKKRLECALWVKAQEEVHDS